MSILVPAVAAEKRQRKVDIAMSAAVVVVVSLLIAMMSLVHTSSV